MLNFINAHKYISTVMANGYLIFLSDSQLAICKPSEQNCTFIHFVYSIQKYQFVNNGPHYRYRHAGMVCFKKEVISEMNLEYFTV